jgi:hypothetical protein
MLCCVSFILSIQVLLLTVSMLNVVMLSFVRTRKKVISFSGYPQILDLAENDHQGQHFMTGLSAAKRRSLITFSFSHNKLDRFKRLQNISHGNETV